MLQCCKSKRPEVINIQSYMEWRYIRNVADFCYFEKDVQLKFRSCGTLPLSLYY
jgi:hypothetical protein